jgi:hypothetical protein
LQVWGDESLALPLLDVSGDVFDAALDQTAVGVADGLQVAGPFDHRPQDRAVLPVDGHDLSVRLAEIVLADRWRQVPPLGQECSPRRWRKILTEIKCDSC